jgi:hypothetical protein
MGSRKRARASRENGKFLKYRTDLMDRLFHNGPPSPSLSGLQKPEHSCPKDRSTRYPFQPRANPHVSSSSNRSLVMGCLARHLATFHEKDSREQDTKQPVRDPPQRLYHLSAAHLHRMVLQE